MHINQWRGYPKGSRSFQSGRPLAEAFFGCSTLKDGLGVAFQAGLTGAIGADEPMVDVAQLEVVGFSGGRGPPNVRGIEVFRGIDMFWAGA